MHSIRPRPICRARNTFSPSIALWQHFIAPSQRLRQRPSTCLFTTEAAQSHDDVDVDSTRKERPVDISGKIRWVAQVGSSNVKRLPLSAKVDAFRGKGGQDLLQLLQNTYEAYDSGQDYEGVVVQPVFSPRVREDAYPWVVKDSQSGEARLNLEIKKFHEFIRPSPSECLARKHVIEQVREHVRKHFPTYALEVFGSEKTGIAFAGSDIDLRLVPKDVMSDVTRSRLPPKPHERTRRRRDLTTLHYYFKRTHKKRYILPTLRWARYPLIAMQDRTSGLDIQIVLSNDTSISREYMQRYMEDYPYLPEVYSVIKAALDIRGLTDVFRGGIGSYSLFMMVVASLKHKPAPSKDAAGALVNFLRFWGHLNTTSRGVSIEPTGFFEKLQQPVMGKTAMEQILEGKSNHLPKFMLTLRDPADETNDLGRKIVAWKHVQVTFKSMLKGLRTTVSYNDRPSMLAGLVGPVYTLQQAHRKKLTDYGLSLAQAAREYSNADYHSQQSVGGGVKGNADSRAPSLDHFAAVAKAIRESKTANKQSALKAAPVATINGENDGLNPWLQDVQKESAHKETQEAFSDLLGLDKKPKADKEDA